MPMPPPAGPRSQIYPEDVVQLDQNGVVSYAIVTRCWADEQGPEPIAEAARLGIPFIPLAPGQLEVNHPSGIRTEVAESSVQVVDRGFLSGDVIRLSEIGASASSGATRSQSTQAGIITSIATSVQLEAVLSGEKLEGWFGSDDLIGYHLLTRGDHVIFEDWVGLVEEVFECATVETTTGGLRRICDMGGSFQIGATPATLLDDRITTFLEQSNEGFKRVTDVRQIVIAVNWLCVSQLIDEERMRTVSMHRPKRYWTDLNHLALVRSSADHLHSVGDKVTFRKAPPSTSISTSTVFTVTRSQSIVSAIFQDGSTLTSPSPTFEHCINIDDDVDVFPGDIGLFHSGGSSPPTPQPNAASRPDALHSNTTGGRIGIVQSMNPKKRTIKLRYLDSDPPEIETISGLEFDPHGPPPEVYGVRRGDWVMVTKGGNGVELPTVPRLGESESAMGLFPHLEELRQTLATIGLQTANDLGDEPAPIPLIGSALAHINWYAEVLDLHLDGTVVVRYPAGNKETLPLDKLYHIDDGLTPEGEMGMDGDDMMDDDGMSDKSWETEDDVGEEETVQNDEGGGGSDDELDEDGWPTAEALGMMGLVPRGKRRKTKEKGKEKGWADEQMEVEDGEDRLEEEEEPVPEGEEIMSEKSNGKKAGDDGEVGKKEAVSMPKEVEEDENWMRFKVLEEAPPDHHYFKEPIQVPSKAFMSRVKKEYNVLASSLPPNILVRAYEDRADLLRCMIIGPLGTPFQNAPFLFDIFLSPTKFPQEPPSVFFHSWAGGTRISPNLYAEGKCCLSLLNTWHGDKSESWSAARSSILQVFISIQSLIMVEEPYYTEPGFEKQAATPEGQANSELYNERTFVLTRAFVKRAVEYPPSGFIEEIRAYYQVGLATTGLGALSAIVEQAKALLEESDAFHKEAEGQEDDEERKKRRSVVLPELRIVTEGAALSLRRTLAKLEELQAASTS